MSSKYPVGHDTSLDFVQELKNSNPRGELTFPSRGVSRVQRLSTVVSQCVLDRYFCLDRLRVAGSEIEAMFDDELNSILISLSGENWKLKRLSNSCSVLMVEVYSDTDESTKMNCESKLEQFIFELSSQSHYKFRRKHALQENLYCQPITSKQKVL